MESSSLFTKKKLLRSKLLLTNDDTKILGHVERRRERTILSEGSTGSGLKTQNSCWTPVVHKPSNQQLFKERVDMISHWFDMWTDPQRHQFLDQVFNRCSKSQYVFVQRWFDERVPFQHLDFTRVLPRFLSLYIFSFLEPKSLSRAAQVSWHWRFLTEQDAIWMPKCLMRGWFLPYSPADNEYAGWKRHYISCVNTMDYVLLSEKNDIYGNKRTFTERKISHSLPRTGTLYNIRPSWKGPDLKPKDLERSFYAFLYGINSSNQKVSSSLVTIHNRWPMMDDHEHSYLTKSLNLDQPKSSNKNDRYTFLYGNEEQKSFDRRHRMLLSEVQALENINEIRLRQLVEQPWEFNWDLSYSVPTRRGTQFSSNVWSDVTHSRKRSRIILISSRVAGPELLFDATHFDVIPIVYKYEGTTVDGLRLQVEHILSGRNVESIGLFCHEEEPGRICLVDGCSVNTKCLQNRPDVRTFFNTLSSFIVKTEHGGQFHIFAPLAASEEGMDLLAELTAITGIQYSTPTAIVGGASKVLGGWLFPSRRQGGCPSLNYFNENRLSIWANMAKQTEEAIRHCKHSLAPFFRHFHQNIVSRLAGQIVFEVMGQVHNQGITKLTPVLTEGLISLGNQKNVDALQYLTYFLMDKCGFKQDKQEKLHLGSADPTSDPQDEEVARINSCGSASPEKEGLDQVRFEPNLTNNVNVEPSQGECLSTTDINPSPKIHEIKRTKDVVSQFDTLRELYGTIVTVPPHRLTVDELSVQPNKRSCVAMEIMTTEMEYVRLLAGFKAVYFKPLKSALDSNRAILSMQNLEIIFTDILTIHKLHRELCENLKNRYADWDGMRSCLGDIFVSFCNNLRAYVNFVNNYEAILRCLERAKELVPNFRAFLSRHQRRPEARMLTLQELLFVPVDRIGDYVTLLSWFQLHTPKNHPDRTDLCLAISSFSQMNTFIQEAKIRLQQERELVQLHTRIINCPVLVEGNRYFLKQQDVSLLKPMSSAVASDLRVYQCTETLGLYLFNDTLVVTRRVSRHFPLSVAEEYLYTFESCLSLATARVKNIANSKYVSNAFKLMSPSVKLYCCTDSHMDKVKWLSILQQTIRAVQRM